MISQMLNSYLDNSRITLNRLARNLDMSAGYLSELKNGNKKPSLDVLLKIADKIKLPTNEKEQLVSFYNQNQSDKYDELQMTKAVEKKQEKLSEEASFKLAKDADLFNAFLDIQSTEKKGMTEARIINRYGLGMLQKLEYLTVRNIINKENQIYYTKNTDKLMLAHRTSFVTIKSMIDNEENQWDAGVNEGRTRWNICDLDDEGKKMYYEMIARHDKEFQDLRQNHSKDALKGGHRIGHFSGMTVLKQLCLLFLFLFLFVNIDTNLYASGGAGGGTDAGGGGPKYTSSPVGSGEG